jgi:hypothetical protein
VSDPLDALKSAFLAALTRPRPRILTPYEVEHYAKLAKLSDDEVKHLWDACPDDGSPDENGFDCDIIHAELNRRGLGLYCAV